MYFKLFGRTYMTFWFQQKDIGKIMFKKNQL